MTDLFDIDWGFGTPETPAPAEPPEAQSEPKGRKTRSHLKAKVYETSDKFEYRRAFSEVQLLDALGGRFEFKPGTAYHFLTAGNIDSPSFLKAVLRQQSVRHLVVSTWCMGADDILWFREQAETGRIEKMDLYLGEIFSGSYRTEFSMVKDLYTDHPELGRYALFRNHSKIMAGFLYKQLLIWVKNTITLTRSDYQWQHEPCIYGWKDGGPHYFTDDRTLRTVVDQWPDFDKMDKAALRDFCKRVFNRDALATDIVREDKPLRNAEHPTMKPIPLMGRFIRNSSRRGGQVIDLFGGSGSTLMACEQLGRHCRTMEYDPKYCDVIITRWEKYTGRKATKID